MSDDGAGKPRIPKVLTHELREVFQRVVVQPDHPKLLDGPDILAATTTQLVAFFIPKHVERASVYRLKARLSLSRLVLPEPTLCVLTMRQDDLDIRWDGPPERDFHAVMEIGSDKVQRTVSAAGDNVRVGRVPAQIRRSVADRASRLVQLSQRLIPQGIAPIKFKQLRRRRVSKPPHSLSATDAMQALMRQPGLARQLRAFSLDGNVVTAREQLPRPLANIVRQVVAPAFQIGFVLDNGVPYPRAAFAGVLVAPHSVEYRDDPLRPLRSAAIAGWSVSRREVGEWERSYLEAEAWAVVAA